MPNFTETKPCQGNLPIRRATHHSLTLRILINLVVDFQKGLGKEIVRVSIPRERPEAYDEV